MKAGPQATILVPLLRQTPEYLQTALDSALHQTVPVEVLVVTSSQTPASNLSVLSAAQPPPSAQLRIVERPRDGYALGLNHGFREASCDRVALLLTDDWLEPTAVEAALALDADVVSTGRLLWHQDFSEQLVLIDTRVGSAEDFPGLPTLERQASYVTHMLLLSRPLVLAVGGVDETLSDLAGVDDFDLVWTLLEAGARVAFTDAPQYNMRDHAGERLTLRPRADQEAALRRILDKHGVSDTAEREEIIARHARWYGRTISSVLAEEPQAS